MSEQVFLEMKNYSFFFDDDRFDMDIVSKVEDNQLYELYFDEKNLYILVPLLEDSESSMQIMYPLKEYNLELSNIRERLVWQALLLSFIAFVISLLFSFYSLNPLRKALMLLEEFIRDIIHDLNTPITSILINLKMMERNEEVESIVQSAKTISMLHKNLDVYLRNQQLKRDACSLKELIENQVDFFMPLYDYLNWEVNIEERTVVSNDNALNRILYNLISNACKYNTSDGFIKIELKENRLMISNSSYGIKKPSKVFNRFYKESERGLGIGLHIVEKLCLELGIEKKLEVKENIVTISLIFDEVTFG